MHERTAWTDWVDGIKQRYSGISTDTGQTDTATFADMDDYFFQNFVRGCRNVSESTSYLEVFNYSVRGSSCSCACSALLPDDNFRARAR